MIKIVTNGTDPSEVYLLSTDVKPLGVENGSLCYEIDTGKIFMFDAENKIWIEQ